MRTGTDRRRDARTRVPSSILAVLVCVALGTLAGCSQTASAQRGGSFELARAMDFYFLKGWGQAGNGQLQPEYVFVEAGSEDAQALLAGVAWEVDDCIKLVDPRVEIPSKNPRIKWKQQISADYGVRYSVDGLRIDAQATLTIGEGCTPGAYTIVLKMPALGIAAEFLDAGVYFPGKNAPEAWTAPDTLVVTTLEVQ